MVFPLPDTTSRQPLVLTVVAPSPIKIILTNIDLLNNFCLNLFIISLPISLPVSIFSCNLPPHSYLAFSPDKKGLFSILSAIYVFHSLHRNKRSIFLYSFSFQLLSASVLLLAATLSDCSLAFYSILFSVKTTRGTMDGYHLITITS